MPGPAANESSGTEISGGSATVFVSHMSRSVRFYSETLGLKLLYRAGDHFAMIDAGGFKIGLHPPGRYHAPPGTRGCVQIGLRVAAPIRQVIAALESRGVVFADLQNAGDVVVDDGAVKLAYFHDPDGTELYLCESAW